MDYIHGRDRTTREILVVFYSMPLKRYTKARTKANTKDRGWFSIRWNKTKDSMKTSRAISTRIVSLSS